ncbi:MAG: hydroxyacid dehydrogenase, partial [Candidatus Omnitrophica bacterium]|nr:hydroxyacid dehydrogenase [Candidatus Omnitrophota bacterium]
MKIKFYEAFEEEKKQIRKFLPANWVVQFTDQTIQQSKDKNPPAQFISIRTQSKIPAAWALNLKAILTRSQGFDHLIKYQKETGFNGHLGYLEEYCSRTVAEQTIWMMLGLLRKAKQQLNQFVEFYRDGLTGRECLDKKAIVLGAGKIGKEVVFLAKALGMKVKAVDI